jgi:hypothetical protein
VSREAFDENCPGCKPAILDIKTQQPLPDDHVIMQAVHKVWETTTREEREAFHRLTCLNDTSDETRSKLQSLYERIALAIKKSQPST